MDNKIRNEARKEGKIGTVAKEISCLYRCIIMEGGEVNVPSFKLAFKEINPKENPRCKEKTPE